MATVEQEIRLMSEKTFEAFVHLVLKVRYPHADIKKVDGSGGDEGIDCFEGALDGAVSVWQCKHFSARIGKDQKRNILKSIETVFRHRAPRLWTLCVPIDLRTAEHAWFQSAIEGKFGDRCTIKLQQNSDFLLDVGRSPELTKLFFQDTAIATLFRIEEKALPLRHSLDPQAAIQEYIDDLCALDRRLGVIYSLASVDSPLPRAPKDVLFSVYRGYSVIHIVPRDVMAISKNPINIQFTAEPPFEIQINEAIDRGDSFSIPAGALKSLRISSSLLQSFLPQQLDNLRLEATPFLTGERRKLMARIATSELPGGPEIALIHMIETKIGRKERTFEGEIPGLHIQLRVFDAQQAVLPNFTINLGGLPIEDATAIVDFLYSLKESRLFIIYDPERQRIRYRQNIAPIVDFETKLNLTPSILIMLKNVQIVSKYFGQSMSLPRMQDGWEFQSYQLLADILTTGVVSEITFAPNVRVFPGTARDLKRILSAKVFSLSLSQRKASKLPLFGLDLPARPMICVSSSARCLNSKEVLASLGSAKSKFGDRIMLRISCNSCSIRLDKRIFFPRIELADEKSSITLFV
jgi:hypothetical protein